MCTLPCKKCGPIRMGSTTLVAAPWASGCAQFCGAPFVRLPCKSACVGTGADDFLPVLIFVVIHATPPQLASNLEYIQRFRMQSRMASESAYFFTQLVPRPSGRCTVCLMTSRAQHEGGHACVRWYASISFCLAILIALRAACVHQLPQVARWGHVRPGRIEN